MYYIGITLTLWIILEISSERDWLKKPSSFELQILKIPYTIYGNYWCRYTGLRYTGIRYASSLQCTRDIPGSYIPVTRVIPGSFFFISTARYIASNCPVKSGARYIASNCPVNRELTTVSRYINRPVYIASDCPVQYTGNLRLTPGTSGTLNFMSTARCT